MNTPPPILQRRHWAALAVVAAGLLAAVITAQPQAIRIVATLDQLLQIDPRAFSSGGQGLLYVEGRHARGDWGPPRATAYSASSTLATNEYAIFSPTNQVGRWDFPDRNDPVQDARHWPIDWTGSTDATAQYASAIQASADKILRVPSGTNRVTGLLVTNAVAIEFNGTLWRHAAPTTNIMLAIATNYVSVRGLRIDGEGINPSAIRVQSEGRRVFLDQLEIFGLANGTSDIATYGIWVGGNGDWEITRCWLHDFTGTPNGVGGDQYGTVAGIAILAPHVSLSGPPKRALISRCLFENFLPGEDSDGIKISGAPYLWQQGFCPGIIEDCVFVNMGSRAIKPAARGWKMKGIFNRNTFDGSVQASGWARTGGLKIQDEVIAAYGPDLTIEDVTSFGGPVRYFSVISSNEYSSPNITYSNVRFLEDPTLAFTNTTSYGIYSLQGAAQHVRVSGANFETRSGAIYSFAPDGDWDISSSSFRNVSGGTNGAAIVLGRSITNYLQGTQRQYRINNNLFAKWGSAGIFYDVKDVWPQGNLLVEGTGKFSAVNWVVDNSGTNRWATNHISGGYDPAANAGAAVFGEFQTPSWLYSAEFKTRPLWLPEIADEASFGLATNRASMAYVVAQSAPGWFDGQRANFPLSYTHAIATGTTSNAWYRIARCVTTGLGNRYGATIRVGSAGGTAATFDTLIRVTMNYGSGTIQVWNTPVDGAANLALPKTIRLVKDVTNEVTAIDVQASSTSAAQWAVQVVPEVNGPALFPERLWRVGGLTNVASLAVGEVAAVTANSISNRIWSLTEASREASVTMEGTTLAVTATTIDLRGTLLNNSAPISGSGQSNYAVMTAETLVLSNALDVASGGTGGTNAAQALANLGGQPANVLLSAVAALAGTGASGKLLGFTGGSTVAVVDPPTGSGTNGGSTVSVNGVTNPIVRLTNNVAVGGVTFSYDASSNLVGVVTNPPGGLPSTSAAMIGEPLAVDSNGNAAWRGNGFFYYDEQYFGASASAPFGAMSLTHTLSNGGTAQTGNTATDTPGVWNTGTGTQTNGVAFQGTGLSQFVFGTNSIYQLEYTFRTPSFLSSSTERYEQRFGFLDSNTSAFVADGAMFVYRDDTSSGNWTLWSVAGYASNLVNSGVAFTANTKFKLRVDVYGTNSVVYRINDVAIATNSVGIPSGTQLTGFGAATIKWGGSVGTTTVPIAFDRCRFAGKY